MILNKNVIKYFKRTSKIFKKIDEARTKSTWGWNEALIIKKLIE